MNERAREDVGGTIPYSFFAIIVGMDGVHDLGGMDGFGVVPVEVDEPLFHAPWEGRVWRLQAVVMGSTTIDRFRYTIEQMPPAEYLAASYYERWLWAIERLAAEQGILHGTDAPPRVARPSPSTTTWTGRFKSGDRVRVGNPVTTGSHPGAAVSAPTPRPGRIRRFRLAESG